MSDNLVCVLCMIGLPGAGKTYLASQIYKNKLGFTSVVHVEFDELLPLEKNGNMSKMWKGKRKAVFSHVEEIISLHENQPTPNSLLIILDDNMYYYSMRYEFYRLAKRTISKYCQIYLDTPIEICCHRNRRRVSSLPTNHILSINDKLEKPLESNYWEKHTLTLSYTEDIKVCFEKIDALIKDAEIPNMKLPLQKKEFQPSCKHLADLALRKIVSQYVQRMRSTRANNLSSHVAILNKNRQEILEAIDDSKLTFPSMDTVDAYIEHLIPIFQIGLSILQMKNS